MSGLRRALIGLAAVSALSMLAVLALVNLTVRRGDGRRPVAASCHDKLRTDEAAVRSTRWQPPADLAMLGSYEEIHWQQRALSDPCARAPGPTDWVYQGVVTLAPADAAALGSAPGFVPADPQVWDALVAFVPAGVQWRRAPGTDLARRVYVDGAKAVALFVFADR